MSCSMSQAISRCLEETAHTDIVRDTSGDCCHTKFGIEIFQDFRYISFEGLVVRSSFL